MLQATFDTVARGGGDGPRFFFPLFLIVLLGFLIAAVIRRRRGGGGHPYRHGPGSGSPMQTLEDRFARGDIERAEFEHRKAVLIGADTVPPAPPAPPAPASAPPVASEADEPKADEDDA